MTFNRALILLTANTPKAGQGHCDLARNLASTTTSCVCSCTVSESEQTSRKLLNLRDRSWQGNVFVGTIDLQLTNTRHNQTSWTLSGIHSRPLYNNIIFLIYLSTAVPKNIVGLWIPL